MPNVVIASPTAESMRDHPIPGSQEMPCSVCGVILYIAPSSLRELDKAKLSGSDSHVLCPDDVELLMIAVQDSDPDSDVAFGRPEGADEELRRAGLDDIAETDQLLAERFNRFLQYRKNRKP